MSDNLYISPEEASKLIEVSIRKIYELRNDDKINKFLGEPVKYTEKPFKILKSHILRLRPYFNPSKIFTRCIAVVNHKGGVGKTTSVANIGVILAYNGKKVLIIDVDFQSNLTRIFSKDSNGKPIEFGSKTLYGCYSGLYNIRGVIHNTRIENLDIIPSTETIAEFDTENFDKKTLKIWMQSMSDYDYIIFDTPPSLSKITDAVLLASTDVLIPIEPSILSLDGLALIKKTITRIKLSNANLNESGVFFTKYDSRHTVAQMMSDHFKSLNTKIGRSVEVENAYMQLKTIYEYNSEHKISVQYRDLAKELFNV